MRIASSAFAAVVLALSALPTTAQTLNDQFNLDFDSFTDQSAYQEKARKRQDRLNSLLTREELTNGYQVTLLQENSVEPESNPKPTNQKQAASKKTNLRHLASRQGYYSVCTTDKKTGEEREFAVAVSFAYDVNLARAQGISPQVRFDSIGALEQETYRFLTRLSKQKAPYTPLYVSQISNLFFDNLSAYNDVNPPKFYRAIRSESGIVVGPGCRQEPHDAASFEKLKISFIDGTTTGTPNEPEIKAGMEILNVRDNVIAQKTEFLSVCSDDKSKQIVAPLVIAYNMTAAYQRYLPASTRIETYKLVQDNARDYLNTLAYAPDAYLPEYALNVRANFMEHIRISVEFAQKNIGLYMGTDVPNIPIAAAGCDQEADWTWDKYTAARDAFIAAGSDEARTLFNPPAPANTIKAPGNSKASSLISAPI